MTLTCFALATATLLVVGGDTANIFQSLDVLGPSGLENKTADKFEFNLTSNPALYSTTAEPSLADNNETFTGIQVTDYKYIDFSKIGYQMFLRKIIDALKTLNLFLKMGSLVVQRTKTFILTNKTDDDDNSDNRTLAIPFISNMIPLPVDTPAEPNFENNKIKTNNYAKNTFESNAIPLHDPLETSFKNEKTPQNPIETYDKNIIPTIPTIETNTESPFKAFPTESTLPPYLPTPKAHNPLQTELQYLDTKVTPSVDKNSQNNSVKEVKKAKSENVFSTISHAIGGAFHSLTGWIG